ncbi:MAG TPA: anti-sigma factor, partial [Gemmatimonadales bacterium]|nr:anti-sigma factor [Gemmatimonadales bacterium]
RWRAPGAAWSRHTRREARLNMSHVDEGTLHAYLDGELTPVERERVDTHLKGCPACQARLAEERAIIERSSRLLGMASPPERAIPPLGQLRQPRLTWRLRRPLAWAATLILAVGLGWYARGKFPGGVAQQRGAESDQNVAARPAASPTATAMMDSQQIATRPEGHLAMRRQLRPADSIAKDRDALQRQTESAEVVTGAAASNAVAAVRETTAVATLGEQKVDATAELPRPTVTGLSVRGRADAAAPAAHAVPAPQTPQPQAKAAGAPAAMGAASSGVIVIDGARVRRAPALLTTSWPLIARQPARDVLGVEPVVIPGFAIRAYRRNPAAREIVVEQVTDAGTAISLIERRVDYATEYGSTDSAVAYYAPSAMAKAVNERLARFVGLLRVEIDGPLTPDSLSSLLELAR